jgi:hypothetical protein
VDISAIAVIATVGAIFIFHHQQQTKREQQRGDASRRCVEETDECQSSSFSSQEETPRLASLRDLVTFLEPLLIGTSVEEANKRREILYDALTADGANFIIPEPEGKDTKRGGSQRAAIIMCDEETSQMLQKARSEILQNTDTSDDYLLRNFHVPLFQITSPSSDREPMSTLLDQFRTEVQPFPLELDRFVVFGDMIVALWESTRRMMWMFRIVTAVAPTLLYSFSMIWIILLVKNQALKTVRKILYCSLVVSIMDGYLR